MGPNEVSEVLEAFSLCDESAAVRVEFFFANLEGVNHDFVESFFDVVNLVVVEQYFQFLLVFCCAAGSFVRFLDGYPVFSERVA